MKKKLWALLAVVCIAARSPADESAYDSREMHEDVATMKTLLERAIANSYGLNLFVQTSSSSPVRNWHHSKAEVNQFGQMRNSGHRGTDVTLWTQPANWHHHTAQIEGNVVEGHGVVFSVSAPRPFSDPMKVWPKPDGKSLSDWEKVRRELLGDKGNVTKKKSTWAPMSLSESLLRVLAENGRHFSKLKPEDKITVAVTFDAAGSCTACHSAGSFDSMQQSSSSLDKQPSQGSESPVNGIFKTVEPYEQLDVVKFVSPATTEVQNNVLLGDLHSKQGKHQEAIKAYQKAKRLHLPVITKEMSSADQAPGNLKALSRHFEICHKLAQAYAATGDQAAALKELDYVTQLQRDYLDAAQKKKTDLPRHSKMKLPAKLVVSASKKDLDSAGSGKITFAELRTRATLKYLRFSDVAPKK